MANEYQASATAEDSLKNLFTSVTLFSGFPDVLIQEIKHATSVIQVAPEDVILRQGEVNKNLYFLVLGTVDIYVDGGHVATLRRKGDLLGEMSVITNKPCSATIIAKTPVELICVNTEDFKRITGNNTDQFDHILYRIYSMILTDKINITNQKAKRLEETAEALTRAKNELQEANAQLERRVAERTQALQTKLQGLLTGHLQPLQTALAALKDEKSLAQVREVIHYLEPIVQTFNLEVSMKTKRVLLAQGDKKAQTISKMALGGTGVAIELIPAEQAKDKVKAEKYDVVLIDGATLDIVDMVRTLEHKPKIVFVASATIQDSLPKLLNLLSLPNIIFVREDDRAGSIRTIMTTVTKLCSPNIFGLEKYLNVGVDVKEMKIAKSTERQMLNDEMRESFTKLGVRGSILDSVSTVLEELLMNAIYDAPTGPNGNPLYNSLPRTTPVDLRPNEQGLFRFALDGTHLAISVEDPFGALTAKTIMNYLDSCYGNKAGEMQKEKGGAGRGLHQIVEQSAFVVFNVQPKRRTEVIAFFDLVPGQKEAKAPTLHYFVQG